MNTNPLSTPTPAGRLRAGLRLVATPLTIATFLLCGGTGLALFFDVHSRAIKVLHEWSGIAMGVAVALHLVRNWHPTLTLFRRWPVWTALGGATIAAVWMLVFTPAAAAPRHARERLGHDTPTPGAVAAPATAARGECGDACDGDGERGGRRHDGRGRGLHRGEGDGPRRDGSGRDRD